MAKSADEDYVQIKHRGFKHGEFLNKTQQYNGHRSHVFH